MVVEGCNSVIEPEDTAFRDPRERMSTLAGELGSVILNGPGEMGEYRFPWFDSDWIFGC